MRTDDGTLVWDSGDAFECITSLVFPANFNASNSNNTFDNRSDDKGPEPENVVVGQVGPVPLPSSHSNESAASWSTT